MPAVGRLLEELGENIRLARLRRGFSMELVAERAGHFAETCADLLLLGGELLEALALPLLQALALHGVEDPGQ